MFEIFLHYGIRLIPTGYAPQAEYHTEMAKSIMLHGAHVSASVQEKADIYRVLISMYYTLGRAHTSLKKYPCL